MEGEIEPKEACENCGIMLPESKLPLHEAYCIRFCRKCDKCGEFFSKDILEVHKEECDPSKKQEEEKPKSEQEIIEEKPQDKKNEEENKESDQMTLTNKKQASETQDLDEPGLEKDISSVKLLGLENKLTSHLQSDKVRCSNCKKQILNSKIDLHEVQCKRQNVQCPYCSEFVLKDMLEEHIQDTHVKCNFCKKTIDQKLRQEHEKICKQGGRQCNLCEVTFPFNEFEDHQEYCGGTTDNCYYCFKFVLKKELKLHDKVCVMKQEELTLKPLQKHQSTIQVDENTFKQYIKDQIQIFCVTSDISTGRAIYILDEYGWDFEQAPLYAQSEAIELSENDNNQLQLGSKLGECIACLKQIPTENDYYALKCDHRACNECYQHWLTCQLKTGPRCLQTCCIFDKCPEKVGYEGFEKFLNGEQIEKYYNFLKQSALTTSPKYIMCPNRNCQTVLEARNNETFHMKRQLFNVFCDKCEDYFCNLCTEEPHKPLQCSMYQKFQQKKQSLQHNQIFHLFKKEEAKTKILIKQKEQKIKEFMEKLLQNKSLNGLQREEINASYRQAVSTVIEAQILIQWSRVVDLFECFPSPIVELWIFTNLSDDNDKLDKLLELPVEEIGQPYIIEVRDHLSKVQKLISDILEEFKGKKQSMASHLNKNSEQNNNNFGGNSNNNIEEEEEKEIQQNHEEELKKLQERQEKEQQERMEQQKKEQEQLEEVMKKSQQMCSQCNQKPATLEGQLCDTCFDLLYNYDYDDEDYDYD